MRALGCDSRCMTTYYHGSTERITAINGTICLTTDYAAAEDYALRKDGAYGQTGYVHTIDLHGLNLASEDDLRTVAAAVLGDLSWYPYTYELADNPQVCSALADRGYRGVSYPDQTITGRAHDCVLVWHTQDLSVTDIVEA